MRKYAYLLLFMSIFLLGAARLQGGVSMSTLVYGAMAVVSSVTLAALLKSRRESIIMRQYAEMELRRAHCDQLARREAKAKIPKNSPRRESSLVRDGAVKLSAVRSMAALIRRPHVRERVLEVCDLADLVLETIRRVPNDTPAAKVFIEKNLASLQEAIDFSFEICRNPEYKELAANEAHEIEFFGSFVNTFCKQQDTILHESKGDCRTKGRLLA